MHALNNQWQLYKYYYNYSLTKWGNFWNAGTVEKGKKRREKKEWNLLLFKQCCVRTYDYTYLHTICIWLCTYLLNYDYHYIIIVILIAIILITHHHHYYDYYTHMYITIIILIIIIIIIVVIPIIVVILILYCYSLPHRLLN